MKADNRLIGNVEISEAVIGAAFEVANTLGCGFLEKVYENALAVELRQRHHDVEQQKPIEVWYKGQVVGMYQADMLVDGQIVVELKSVASLDRTHRNQCLNYLNDRQGNRAGDQLRRRSHRCPARRGSGLMTLSSAVIRFHPCSSVFQRFTDR